MARRAKRRLPTLECAACGQEYTKVHQCPAADRQCRHCDKYGHFSGFCQKWHSQQHGNKDQSNVKIEAFTFDFPHEKLAYPYEPVKLEEFCETMNREASCEVTNDVAPLQEKRFEHGPATSVQSCNAKKRKAGPSETCNEMPRRKRQRRTYGSYKQEIYILKDHVNAQREENYFLRRQRCFDNNTNTMLRKDNQSLRKQVKTERTANITLREEIKVLKKRLKDEKNVKNCTQINIEILRDDFKAARARNDELERRLSEEKGLVMRYQEKLNMYRNTFLNKNLNKMKTEMDKMALSNAEQQKRLRLKQNAINREKFLEKGRQ